MANSSLVSGIKDKVIAEIVDDEEIFHAIYPEEIESFDDADELVGTHIFRFNQNPLLLDLTSTFITIQVHISKTYGFGRLFSKLQLEIWIVSHVGNMNVKNVPKISANRNDYISQLIDAKFNGRSYLGTEDDPNKLVLLGNLDLVSNTEGALQKEYLYRRMIFEATDLNDSLCDGGRYV